MQEEGVMCSLRRKIVGIKLLVFWLSFLMVSQGVFAFAGSDRIYPAKKVTLYRDDKVVGVYTKEAPLPNGSVIATEGRCAVKLEDLYLVAEDQSVFSINTTGRQRNLFIEKGTIYFKTSEMKRSFAFITPDGPINVQRIRLNAAFGDGSIKGYVTVREDQSELGIPEGGSMDVFTDKGLMTIKPGNKMILAQADMDIGVPEDEEPAAQKSPEPTQKWSGSKTVAIGALGIAAAAGIILGLGGSSGGDDNVSPSTP
jgi:hypothetical protein